MYVFLKNEFILYILLLPNFFNVLWKMFSGHIVFNFIEVWYILKPFLTCQFFFFYLVCYFFLYFLVMDSWHSLKPFIASLIISLE